MLPKKAEQAKQLLILRKQAFDHVTRLENEAARMEMEIGIDVRWTPDDEQWKEGVAYLHIREYRLALDRLESLVVSRLLEMSKANLAGTGIVPFMAFSNLYLLNHTRL